MSPKAIERSIKILDLAADEFRRLRDSARSDGHKHIAKTLDEEMAISLRFRDERLMMLGEENES